jgi:hypothetical protein
MTDEISIQQKNSIKLMKMSKGYNWEIKVISDNPDEIIPKIEELNKRLKILYGEICNTSSE